MEQVISKRLFPFFDWLRVGSITGTLGRTVPTNQAINSEMAIFINGLNQPNHILVKPIRIERFVSAVPLKFGPIYLQSLVPLTGRFWIQSSSWRYWNGITREREIERSQSDGKLHYLLSEVNPFVIASSRRLKVHLIIPLRTCAVGCQLGTQKLPHAFTTRLTVKPF